jgi:hypothetical protein
MHKYNGDREELRSDSQSNGQAKVSMEVIKLLDDYERELKLY